MRLQLTPSPNPLSSSLSLSLSLSTLPIPISNHSSPVPHADPAQRLYDLTPAIKLIKSTPIMFGSPSVFLTLQRLNVFCRCPPRVLSVVFQHRPNVSKNMGFGSLSCRSFCTRNDQTDMAETQIFYKKWTRTAVCLRLSFIVDEDFYGEMKSHKKEKKKKKKKKKEMKSETIIASGVIISKQGYILTCAANLTHPEGFLCEKIEALFHNGKEYTIEEVEEVASDEDKDLSIMKINSNVKNDLSYATLSKQKIEVGMHVYLISNPRNFLFSFASGIISHPRRIAGEEGVEFDRLEENTILIQSSVVADEGSSGGPLFNWRGEVIGLHCKEIGYLTFAISVESIFEFLKSKVSLSF